ncbi:hypothetical protein PM082_009172 [Marasmius tenuissimus]|nr:hypothetical protein PM082_009172 [Marasmius tenuissimus]
MWDTSPALPPAALSFRPPCPIGYSTPTLTSIIFDDTSAYTLSYTIQFDSTPIPASTDYPSSNNSVGKGLRSLDEHPAVVRLWVELAVAKQTPTPVSRFTKNRISGDRANCLDISSNEADVLGSIYRRGLVEGSANFGIHRRADTGLIQ